MYFDISWHITIDKYELAMLESCQIVASVELLANTATIVVPASVNNAVINTEKIKRGHSVTIWLGYNNTLTKEFSGYLQTITTDDGNITLTCEDDVFLTRKPVANKVFGKTSITPIANYIASQIGGLTVNCTYDMEYEKFVIYKATGYDVLKKLQDDTKANIYFLNGVLNIHPPFVKSEGKCYYNFAENIEQAELAYKLKGDRPFEVEVEGISQTGKRLTTIIGTAGGDKRSIKLNGVTNKADLEKRGKEELDRLSYDGYEGSITGWLIPYCTAGYSVHIQDDDYPYKTAYYFAKTVTTTVSSSGGVRKIDVGIKLTTQP